MNILEKWATLERESLGENELSTIRLSEVATLELFVGIDNKSCRYLLLHLPENFEGKISQFENENITLTYLPDKQLLAIKLLDTNFIDLFDDLISSMYRSIEFEESWETASQKLVDIFIKWNQLFRRLESRTYGEASIMGFWGELFILNQLIKDKTEAHQIDQILNAWTGPLGGVHDFVFEDISLEIKTKLSSTSTIHISSEFQLETDAHLKLELAVVDVEKSVQGCSIESLYLTIKRHVVTCNADLSSLVERLIAFKLDESDLKKYGKYTFKATQTDRYDCIDEQFPKIIRSGIADQISSVKYKLNLSELSKFILSSEKY
ncbi:PD-(D/E)XK motif protein [Glaciecola sp. XM2]|uniref:PD-(D/E)XK motif protein n=1 Tax=Glaciecola sp. XM2 TaxID=1914931 RepID=UPI001BDE9A73|nr:PD-(D/E)XK motif protein [Glaciecola sp. XM2]MBT1451511.1 PD-(D/E)XK motif protein [Glaciecola sp. XM2]